MSRPKPNKLHDELDALLDGRPVELTDELAPLAEAADALRAELAAYQLDPQVAERHLERVLQGSATVVPLPVRGQPSGWDLRRRVAAVVLAAALVLAPATMASAAALPGQPMYPFKLAIEQLRVASVQWSPSREAVERTRVADTRLDELRRLVQLKIFPQVPTALTALSRAVQEAEAAVTDASLEGEPVPTAARKLIQVKAMGSEVLVVVARTVASPSLVPAGTRHAIQAAVRQTQDVLVPPTQGPGSGGPPVTTPTPPSQAGAGSPGSGPSGPPSSQTQPPANSTPEATTTTGAQVTTTTTVAPTTTTAPPEPSTTQSTVTPGSAGGGDPGGDRSGADDKTPTEDPAGQAPGDVPTP
jgi:hypothetical protein